MNIQSVALFMEHLRRIPIPARGETNTSDSKRDAKYIIHYDLSTLACVPRSETQHAALTICHHASHAHLDYTSWHCVPMVAPRILQGIQLSRGCVPFVCSARVPDEVP